MYIFKNNLSKEKFLLSKGRYNTEYLDELKDEYESLKNEKLTELRFSSFIKYSREGERLTYEREYFSRRKMLRDFALAAWLYDDADALKRLEDVMWAVCGEFTWALPAHFGEDIFCNVIDLFAAETAHTLCEIISLLSDKLSETVVKRCTDEIKRRVLTPFAEREKPYSWESAKSNWSGVCGGAVGMTALYLIENSKTADKTVKTLQNAFESYIASFPNDGASLEGLYYWNYGMMYFTAFLDLYEQRMGKAFPVNSEKLKNIADFPNKCCMGNGFTVSFSDGYERDKIYAGLACKISDMFGSDIPSDEYLARFGGDECARWCKAVRDIAWYNTKTGSEKIGTDVLPDAQWAVMRNEAMSAAVKGGSNAEPHNHNDIGSVIIIKGGQNVLCDLGAGEYTADYFSKNRYDIFTNSSLGHSVPIIDGEAQQSGEKFKAEKFSFDENGASMDIAGAYNCDKLQSCMRCVSCENNITVIEDKFVTSEKVEITERFVTRNEAVSDGKNVKIMRDGRCIARVEPHAECAAEIGTRSHSEHDGSETQVTVIDFKFTANGEKIFLVKVL